MVGDHGSPCPMRERDPAAFAAAGFVLIPESDRVNALDEAQSAKLPAGYKRNEVSGRAVRMTSSHTGCGSVESKIGRLNRYDYHHHSVDFPGTSRKTSSEFKVLISLAF